jgi:hypothetical protein
MTLRPMARSYLPPGVVCTTRTRARLDEVGDAELSLAMQVLPKPEIHRVDPESGSTLRLSG